MPLTPQQIISLSILTLCTIAGIFMYLRRCGRLQSGTLISDIDYADMVKSVEDYINESNRGSTEAAIRANDMIAVARKHSVGKTRERQLNQLIILWRSKFEPLFK